MPLPPESVKVKSVHELMSLMDIHSTGKWEAETHFS